MKIRLTFTVMALLFATTCAKEKDFCVRENIREAARPGTEQVHELSVPIAATVHASAHDSLVGLGKVVGLDYYYNCEWKETKSGERIQFHYIWEDTANSGFSKLGEIIEGLGAEILSLRAAPTPEDLQPFSIYMIVDPDTPEETTHPNYLDKEAVVAIKDWVNAGGVLVLMGNDKGNAEFEHFNQLAGQFGIQFNEDSRHRVKGTDYDLGKSDSFPSHPIFDGVRQIYLKEISTLTIETPAEPVLTEDGYVIMASAHFGKGMVWAVGDPWFYNEYIDARKLPTEYQNEKAGRNLFQWLLQNAQRVKN
jgi:unsaturated rhamnogalacturonyl hydrolase